MPDAVWDMVCHITPCGCTGLQRWMDSERASLLACEATVLFVLNFPDSQRHPFQTVSGHVYALGMLTLALAPGEKPLEEEGKSAVRTYMDLCMDSINDR